MYNRTRLIDEAKELIKRLDAATIATMDEIVSDGRSDLLNRYERIRRVTHKAITCLRRRWQNA